VCNLADAIKIMCDFISIENLQRTCQLVGEFHLQCLQTDWGQDVLQFFTTLLFAFMALCTLHSNVTTCSWLQTPEVNYSSDFPMAMDGSLTSTSHACEDNLAAPDAKALSKKERNMEKARIKRQALPTKEAPYQPPSFNFSCPIYPRKFTRVGVIDHL
jgi:hypothetical protein